MRLMAPTRPTVLFGAALLLSACGGRSTPHVDAGTDTDVPDDVGPEDADATADGDANGDVDADGGVEDGDVDGGTDGCGQETWLRVFELDENRYDRHAEAFAAGQSGDILASGTAFGRPWVARFSPSGAVLWQRWLGIGGDHFQSNARSIVELDSGEIHVVSTLFDSEEEEHVVAATQLREDGELVSSVALGAGLSSQPTTSVAVVDDERLVVATELLHSDSMLMVHDMSATAVRRITFEPRLFEVGGLVPRSDGTLWLAASATDPSAGVGLIGVLLLLSAEGDVLVSYYVEETIFWRITAAAPFGEDGVMLIGENAWEHSTDIWVHALDADAEPIWSVNLGNPGDGASGDHCWPFCHDEHGLDVARLTDDTYVVVGTERSTVPLDEGYHHGWMVWLSGSGEELRQVHLGERGGYTIAQSVVATPTGMVVGGQYDVDLFVASLGPTGLIDGDCSTFQTTDLFVRPHDMPVLTEFDITATVEVADVRPVNVEHFEEPFRSSCLCPE